MNTQSAKTARLPLTEKSIRSLIEQHQVCFESWYEYALVSDIRTHNGYALRLSGINCHEGGEHSVPGCPYCRQTYADLYTIATWILPPGDRESKYVIEPFDSAFHFAPNARRRREEIVVTIQVLHRHDPDRVANECELRCLKEMRDKLKLLGVLEGHVNPKFRNGDSVG